MTEKMTQVEDTLRRFVVYCNVTNKVTPQQYQRIIRLQKDMKQENVFVYKYEDACSIIKAVNKLMKED